VARAEIPTWTTPRAMALAAELPPGAAVGEYRIERTIGQGGMGTVYEAVHVVIEKRVALKVLRRELCGNAEAIKRFVQEARAVNRIGHPNIVDVFGFGTTTDGLTFLAMELLTGESLGQRLARIAPPGPLPLPEACHILVEIAEALEAAHGAGIVHRDLKPDNVFLLPARTGPPRVKLLDFGIAKLTGFGRAGQPVLDVTRPGLVVGTPRYIAPEQARGQPIDGRADIYSLGVLAFELLTGSLPFAGDAGVELVAKHVTMRPPRVIERNPALPAVADAIVGQMLEKDPARRPGLREIREAFAQIPAAPPSEEAQAIAASRFEETAQIPHLAEPRRASETTSEAAAGETASSSEAVVVFQTDAAEESRSRARWWLIPVAVLAVVAGVIKVATLVADRSADELSISSGAREIAPAVPSGPAMGPVAAPAEPAPVAAPSEPAPVAAPEQPAPVAAPEQPAPVAAPSEPVEPRPAEVRDPVRARPRRSDPPRESRSPNRTRPQPVGAQPVEPRTVETRTVETRPLETRPAEPRPIEPKRPPPADDNALRDPFAK